MVTNAAFIGRVKKGVETSVYIIEVAVIRILGGNGSYFAGETRCSTYRTSLPTPSLHWNTYCTHTYAFAGSAAFGAPPHTEMALCSYVLPHYWPVYLYYYPP